MAPGGARQRNPCRPTGGHHPPGVGRGAGGAARNATASLLSTSTAKPNQLRAAVRGANEGITSTPGLVPGVAGAAGSTPRVAAGHRPRGFYSALREEVGAVGPGMMSQPVVALHCEGSRLFDLSRSRRTWSRSAVRSTMRRSSSAGVCVEQCDDVAARRPFLLADGDDLSDLAQGQSGGLGGFDERQPSHSVLVVVPVARLLASRFGQHTACSWNRSVFAVRLDRSASSPMRRP